MQKVNFELLCATGPVVAAIMSRVQVNLPLDPSLKDETVQHFMDMAAAVWQGMYAGATLIANARNNGAEVVNIEAAAPTTTTPTPSALGAPGGLISKALETAAGLAK